jgi:hypothetical protein
MCRLYRNTAGSGTVQGCKGWLYLSWCNNRQLHKYLFLWRHNTGPEVGEVSRSHKITHTRPVALLCTIDRLVAEAAIYTTRKHPHHQRDSNPRSQQWSGRRPHGHRDRHYTNTLPVNYSRTSIVRASINRATFSPGMK